jgi:TolB-like protein
MRLMIGLFTVLFAPTVWAQIAVVLPPVALGKKADWKAASSVEKALEAALGTDADLVSVSAAAAKDNKLGQKVIACKGESSCFAELAKGFSAQHALASLVIGKGSKAKLVMVLVQADGSEVDKFSGKPKDAAAQATRMISKVRSAAAATAQVATTDAKQQKGESDRESVAVMGFAVTELEEVVAARLSDATVLGIDKLKLFDVISGDDVQAMLDQQQLKDALSCDSTSCLAELGGALDARYMINGKASKSGEGVRITMTLLDVYEAKAIERDTREMAISAIETDVPGMAKKLFNSILAASGGSVVLSCSEVGASLFIDGDLVTTATGRMFKTLVPGGTHRVEAKKEGFVTWAQDIDVGPESEQRLTIDLMPSQDFIRARIAASNSRRFMGMLSGGVALGLGAGTLVLQSIAQGKFDEGRRIMEKDCAGSCMNGDDFDLAWSASLTKGSLKLNPAAEGLETAKETYTKALGEQNQLLTGSWISLGLAGVSAIYGGWSYFGAEDASRWERFLIDEAPAKVEGDKPAEAAGTKTP